MWRILILLVCSSGLAQGEPTSPSRMPEAAQEPAAYIASQQHAPRGPELSAAELTMVPDVAPRRSVTATAAAEDVARFFYLLEHGYCGYGYFSQENSFDAARAAILDDLRDREHWPVPELVERIRTRLAFVHDCHLTLGTVRFAGHEDFWSAPDLRFVAREGAYYLAMDGGEHALVSVDGQDPSTFLFPSLDSDGRACHCLGTLSRSEPDPVTLVLRADGALAERRVALVQSTYKGRELFSRFRLGGLPVIRMRTFSDHHVEEIEQFLRAADELRGAPCVIIDLRGNGGGNTRWPKEWIRRLTGSTPQLSQTLTELVTRTALIGQANYDAWLAAGPGRAIRDELAKRREGLAARVRAFDEQGARPYWTLPHIPRLAPIENATTLVVVIDRGVASAGEGLLSFLNGQVENVTLVGENTRGALHFGHTSAHRLPHSRLLAVIPVKLNVPLDRRWREELGYEPDYWAPARDALNRACAAVRAGTIATQQPLPPEVLEAEFVPEVPPRYTRAELRRILLTWAVVVVGLGTGLCNRRRGAWAFAFFAAGFCAAGVLGFADNPLARTLAFAVATGHGVVAAAKFAVSARSVAPKPADGIVSPTGTARSVTHVPGQEP